MSDLRIPRQATALACLSFVASLSLPAWAQQPAAAATEDTPPAASATLPPVVVKASASRDTLPAAAPGAKVASGARLGLLGNVDVMDAGFNITSFTAELQQDQRARTVADVLMNDPSVQYTTNSGHMLENFSIRGFSVTSLDLALNGSYGLLPAHHVPVEFLERVELLKGPNALLGGLSPSGGVGGMINLVPKRAGSTPVTELTTSYSSGSYGQLQLDLARRFGEDQRLGLRFNGVYGDGETGVKDQEKGRKLASIGLDYQGDRWSQQLDAYVSRENIDNGSPGMYQMTTLGKVVAAPDSDTNMFRGSHSQADAAGLALRSEYRFGDKSSAYISLGGSNTDTRGLLNGTRVIVKNTSGDATGYIYNITNVVHARNVELGLKTERQTGAVRHQLTLAASDMSYDYWIGNTAITGYAQNIYDPVTPTFPAAPTSVPQTRADEYSGLSAADSMHLFDDKLLLTLGARLQKVNQNNPQTGSKYSESAVSPALAVVVKPWGKNVSLYANYIEGLSPGTTVGTGYTNSSESFAPYKSKQTELGLKLRHGDFSHTFSLFRIDQPSLITLTNSDSSKTQAMDGKQRNQGFEWNFSGQILPELSLLGGYAYTQATYERSTTALTGKNVYGVPTNAITLGADWQTPLDGLSLNTRITHTGDQWLNSANTLRLPAWNRIDLGAKYKTQVAARPVTLRAYVENALDKNYWAGVFSDGFATLSSPRTVRLSATVAF